MAVRGPGHDPQELQEKLHSQFEPGAKKPSAPKSSRSKHDPQAQRAQAKKAGAAQARANEHEEENEAEHLDLHQAQRARTEEALQKERIQAGKKLQEARKTKQREDEDDEGGRGKGEGGEGGEGNAEQDDGKSKPSFAAFTVRDLERGTSPDPSIRIDRARQKGLSQTPSTGEIIEGRAGAKVGASFAEMLPGSRTKASERLPEPDMRPPAFLSPAEAMKDIYLRVKGRASPKTRELLDSPDLGDLVEALGKLHEDEALTRNAESRVKGSIWVKMKDDPGPLLYGLSDPKLSEPWRLFLDGWDIWIPEGTEGQGVELFWEGEAGDEDDGDAISILQSLSWKGGEMTLETRLGPDSDRVTFDGQTFYRLKQR